MKIVHYEKGVIYSDWERRMAAKKIGRLTRYCRRLTNEGSMITMEALRRGTQKKRDSVKVMVTITLPRQTLRAESRRFDVLEAVDRCVEKLERQIERYKERHGGRGRRT
jgi:ribosomal subunit interface protein